MQGLAQLAKLLAPDPVPLNFAEHFELLNLRLLLTPQAPATYTATREELEALRAILLCELQRVRALTQDTPTPWYYSDPAAELKWRRPLAEAKVRADEEAREEKARLKREADEVRLVGLRSKKCAEATAAENQERLKREQEEERRAYARRKREAESWAHLTLTAPEQKWRDSLQQNWAEHGCPETTTEQLIFSAPGDCGRKHWSDSAACACSNVRRGEGCTERPMLAPAPVTTPTNSTLSRPSAQAPAPTRPTRPTSATLARPGGQAPAQRRPTTPTSSTLARPAARAPAPPRPTTPTSATLARPTAQAPAPPRPTTPSSPTLVRPTAQAPALARRAVAPALRGTWAPARPVPLPTKTSPPIRRSEAHPTARSAHPDDGRQEREQHLAQVERERDELARKVDQLEREQRQPLPSPERPPSPPLRLAPPPPTRSTPPTVTNSLSAAPVDYPERILIAVELKSFRSARAVFQEIGGNKLSVFQSLKAMLADGRLVTDGDGVYRAGSRARGEPQN